MTTWLHDLRLDALVEVIARATVLCAVALTVLTSLRGRSAEARELVGRWFLVAIGLLPLLAASGVSIGLLPPIFAAEPATANAAMPGAGDASVMPADDWSAQNEAPARPSVAGWLVLLWGAGTLMLVVLTGLGHLVAMRRLFGAAATPLPDSMRRRLHLPARIPVHVTPTAMQPVVAGLLRARIALPPMFLDWPEAHQSAVIAHELAHIERGDVRTALACRLARALWWPHPLVWRLDRRVALAREQACDDRALRAQSDANAPDYAAALVAVAQQVRASHRFPPPTLAMATTSQLEARVQSLLRPDVNRSRVGPLARLTAASLVLLVGLGCAAADAAKPDPSRPAAEQADDVAPAAADRGGLAQERPIVLTIDASGEVKYAGQVIGASGVRTLVARLLQDGPRRVMLVCAKATRAAVLVRVIDEAKLGGATDVSVASESRPRPVFQPQPLLPPELRECDPARIVVMFLVDEKGNVVDAQLESSSDSRFDQLALAAVARWRFEPGINDGEPVRTWLRIPMVLPAPDGGQDAQGEPVHGVVTDADFDTPLEGARIEVVETGASTVTSKTGGFSLRQTHGTYTLRVTKAGYARQEQAVVVVDGGPSELRVQMKGIYADLPPLEVR
jgi:TonB family protein